MALDAATRRAFTSLVACAAIDGRIADAERQYLARKASEFGISRGEADEFIQKGLQGAFTVAIPPTPAGKQALFDEMLDIVCADGRLESQEKQLMLRFSSHLGVDPGDLGQRVRERLNQRRNEQAAPQAQTPHVHGSPALPQTPVGQAPRVAPAPPAQPRSVAPKPEPVMIIEDKRPPQPPRTVVAPPANIGPTQVAASRVVNSPVPVRLGDEPQANPLLQGRASLLDAAPGPISLGGPIAMSSQDISPITRELVKNSIRFDGREEAIAYVQRTCGVTDAAAAARLVDKLIAEDPECVPGSQKQKNVRQPSR
jgi:uncharacterized tellurite resistance protein B-like protein